MYKSKTGKKTMNINLDDIFNFYEQRIKCHVKAVNYFANLLGYSFPEHDSDKVVEPIRTGYSYIFYSTYHKNFHPLPQHIELCNEAIQTHHKHASHHVEHYDNVTDIPDIRLYEIVSDWASANFEQMSIQKKPDATSLWTWFERNMSHYGWSEHQIEIIKKSIDIFDSQTDDKAVLAIWQPLLEKSDL